MNKNRKKGKGLFIALIVFVSLIVLHLVVTNIVVLSLRSYIKSFDKIEYENQIVPTLEYESENNGFGYYTFTTDEDFKVLQLTDIHLCGGIYSYKRDKKTIYEVMSAISQEKPDLVVLTGDNTFCVPAPIFNGGGTFNNLMTAKTVQLMFETLGVYYTTVFGNHDTEAFDFYDRGKIGDSYQREELKYSIFHSDFTDKDTYKRYSVSNQIIVVRNSNNIIRNVLLMLDTNDYIDGSIMASINWQYDTIHLEQVDWAVSSLKALKQYGDIKTIAYSHIPLAEYKMAYDDYLSHGTDTIYLGGVWAEKDTEVSLSLGDKTTTRIWYGGVSESGNIKDKDLLFERLTQDGEDQLNTLIAYFCGHDHTNNALVKYKDVYLAYGYSIDNSAYSNIALYGKQRGTTSITLSGSELYINYKNLYKDYNINPNEFFEVDLDAIYYETEEGFSVVGTYR